MRKLFLLLFFFISSFSYAQKDSSRIGYVAISIGYGFDTKTQNSGNNNNNNSTTFSKVVSSFGTDTKVGSFGKGTKAAIRLGYCWRPLLHFELAMSYKQGISYKTKVGDSWGGGSSPYYSFYTVMQWISSPQFQLLPSVKLNLGHRNNAYFKVGAVFNIKNKLIKDSLNGDYNSWWYSPSQNGYNSRTVHQITEFTKPVSLGFIIAEGFEHYNKKHNFAFFFEISYIYMKWKASKVNVTNFQLDARGTYTANFQPVYENNERSSCSFDIATGVKFDF